MANGGPDTASVLRQDVESGPLSTLVLRLFSAIRRQAEADRIRWAVWLPVALGTGVGVYFALPAEPGWNWTLCAGALTLTLAACALAIPQGGLRIVLALLTATSLGFTVAKLRTEAVRAPVLARQIGPVGFDARVVSAEPRGNGSRMVLQPVRIKRVASEQTPARIRVTVRARSAAPQPGSWVHVTAVLMPPPGPATPGDYDFGRSAYYRQIGAVGYLYGRPKAIAAPRENTWRETLSNTLERLRARMTARIRQVLPRSNGAIAAALITGERLDVDPDDEEAYRYSGLTHILSIGGTHLALAGGIFFWAIRALFALIPAIALRFPIKKWAAVAAVAGATFYLLISGCDWPAVRSYIMLTIMFLAILLDRPALSMRAIALAAALIMLVTPECLIEPGCEMSFACVIGLIALAEWAQARRAKKPGGERKTLFARLWRYVVGIVSVSTVASLASAPIAIFYFDRAAQYGLLSNLAAESVVGFVIMPAATAAMVLMPVGLDHWPLIVMGWGVDAMTAIAYWTAALPGAASLVPAWPLWCLIAVMGGGLWIALWRKPWRWFGLAPVAVGIVFALMATPPDVLIARDGRTVAVRLETGRLALIRRVTDDFAAANWLRRAGDGRLPEEAIGGPGVACDVYGCLARAHGGVLVAIDERADALAEDCANAAIVISMVPARRMCSGPKLVIDRFDVARAGGYAVWLGETIRIETVERERGRRPWSMQSRRRPN
jgi:competence protein ComEC